MYGFQATAEDLERVLRVNFLRISANEEISFESLAERLLPLIDQGAVEKAALKHSADLQEQTEAAEQELETQLVKLGALAGADELDERVEPSDAEASQVQRVEVRLAIDFTPEGTPLADIVTALERNIASAIGMGLLTGDGPATVSEYSVSVEAMDPGSCLVQAQAVEEWLQGLVANGVMSVEDLTKLAGRYACSDRTTLMAELHERMKLGVDNSHQVRQGSCRTVGGDAGSTMGVACNMV